jgi:hypothetical protein
MQKRTRPRAQTASSLLSGSVTPVSIHTYVPENMVVDVPEDDNRSVVFSVQNFHLEQFQPPFRSTPIPRTDDVRERDRIRQRRSQSNQLRISLKIQF